MRDMYENGNSDIHTDSDESMYVDVYTNCNAGLVFSENKDLDSLEGCFMKPELHMTIMLVRTKMKTRTGTRWILRSLDMVNLLEGWFG